MKFREIKGLAQVHVSKRGSQDLNPEFFCYKSTGSFSSTVHVDGNFGKYYVYLRTLEARLVTGMRSCQ